MRKLIAIAALLLCWTASADAAHAKPHHWCAYGADDQQTGWLTTGEPGTGETYVLKIPGLSEKRGEMWDDSAPYAADITFHGEGDDETQTVYVLYNLIFWRCDESE